MEQLLNLLFAKDCEGLKKAFGEGALPHTQDKYGRSLFAYAAACGYIEVMQTLLDAGADINQPNSDDLAYTPLIEAVREGRDNTEPVKWLLDNGADIEGGDSINGKAVVHACVAAHPNILHYLLENGANVNAVNNNGETALHILCRDAKRWGSATITQTIDGVSTQIENPRFKQHSEIFQILLENGADVNLETNYGFSPLHFAAESDTDTFIPPLVAQGADVNKANGKLFTPLHGACDKGNINAVKTLIEAGANVNVVDEDGFTPLLGAVMANNYELAEYLLRQGASKEAKAKIAYGKVAVGDTPLSLAEKIGSPLMIELLYG